MKHESYRSPMASYDIKEYFERRLEPAPLISQPRSDIANFCQPALDILVIL